MKFNKLCEISSESYYTIYFNSLYNNIRNAENGRVLKGEAQWIGGVCKTRIGGSTAPV